MIDTKTTPTLHPLQKVMTNNLKIDMAWKIPMFNKKYTFIHAGFSSQPC